MISRLPKLEYYNVLYDLLYQFPKDVFNIMFDYIPESPYYAIKSSSRYDNYYCGYSYGVYKNILYYRDKSMTGEISMYDLIAQKKIKLDGITCYKLIKLINYNSYFYILSENNTLQVYYTKDNTLIEKYEYKKSENETTFFNMCIHDNVIYLRSNKSIMYGLINNNLLPEKLYNVEIILHGFTLSSLFSNKITFHIVDGILYFSSRHGYYTLTKVNDKIECLFSNNFRGHNLLITNKYAYEYNFGVIDTYDIESQFLIDECIVTHENKYLEMIYKYENFIFLVYDNTIVCMENVYE